MDTSSPRRWQIPRLRKDGRLLAGVAGGIADEIGIDPIVVRLGFVVLIAAGGWGAMLYGICWAAFSFYESRHPEPRVESQTKGRSETERTVAFVMVVVGLLLMIKDLGLGFADAVVWPVVLLAAGAILAWRRTVTGPVDELKNRTWQITVGGALMLISLVLMVQLNFDFRAAFGTVVVLGLLFVGGVLLFGPLAYRLWRDLMEERRLRIRSEEKAEMAAHLHDSVLQTLTLMQQSSHDQQRVAALARQQERELREWLYGDEAPETGRSLRIELKRLAADIEKLHGVPIEIVIVGDAELDRNLGAAVGAAREAMANAVRHSGATQVDVYAEMSEHELEIFVRDKGSGFDLDEIPADRRGITESIVARMVRAGGEAVIHSQPGEGTEVELRMTIDMSAEKDEEE